MYADHFSSLQQDVCDPSHAINLFPDYSMITTNWLFFYYSVHEPQERIKITFLLTVRRFFFRDRFTHHHDRWLFSFIKCSFASILSFHSISTLDLTLRIINVYICLPFFFSISVFFLPDTHFIILFKIQGMESDLFFNASNQFKGIEEIHKKPLETKWNMPFPCIFLISSRTHF